VFGNGKGSRNTNIKKPEGALTLNEIIDKIPQSYKESEEFISC
jgi:hypothetical protein